MPWHIVVLNNLQWSFAGSVLLVILFYLLTLILNIFFLIQLKLFKCCFLNVKKNLHLRFLKENMCNVCICMWVCVHEYSVYKDHKRCCIPGSWSHRYMGTGNWTQELWKINTEFLSYNVFWLWFLFPQILPDPPHIPHTQIYPILHSFLLFLIRKQTDI